MMDKTVIQFDQVTKIYKLFKSDRQRFKALFSKKAKYKEKIAAGGIGRAVRQERCRQVHDPQDDYGRSISDLRRDYG